MRRPNIEGLDPAARRDLLILLAKAKDAGIPVTPTSGKRTTEEQAALYARYKAGKSKFPAAPPGRSKHEKGLAVDLVVPREYQERFNKLAAAHGYKWHGPGDRVHFDYVGAHVKEVSPLPSALPKPKAQGFSAFIDRPKQTATPKAQGFSAFIDRPKQTGGKAAVADLMGQLTRGEHLQPGTKPAAKPAPRPAAAPTTGIVGMLSRLAEGIENIPFLGPAFAQQAQYQAQRGPVGVAKDLYTGLGQPGKAVTAATSEFARTLRRPEMGADQQALAALRAGGRALMDVEGSEKPQALGIALGVTEKTPAIARVPVTIADWLLSIRTDPMNVLGDPILREAGAVVAGGVKAGVAKLGRHAGTVKAATAAERAALAAPAEAERLRAGVTRATQQARKMEAEAGRLLDQGKTAAATKRYEQAARRQQQASALSGAIPATRAAAAARPTGAPGTLARGGVKVDTKAVSGLDQAPGKGAGDSVKRMASRIIAHVGAGPDAKRTAEEVRRGIDATTGIWRVVRGIVGTVKGGMVGNPATAATGSVGGYLMSKLALDTAGVHGDRLHGALGAALAEAKAAGKGVLSPDIEELNKFSNAFRETATGAAATGLTAPTGALTKILRAPAQPWLDMQGFSDRAFKLATFKALKQAGKGSEEAAKLVDRFLFDYSDRSALLEFVERYGIAPFSTFGAKAGRAFVEGVATRPDLMRRFLQARERMFADPDDRKAYEKLPDYEKGLFTLPLGDGKFANLNRHNPFGGSLNTLQAARAWREGKPPEAFIREQLGRPLIAKPIDALRDLRLSGEETRDLSPEGAPIDEFRRVFLREMGKAFLPGLAPGVPFVSPGGRGYQALAEAVGGVTAIDGKGRRPQSPQEALAQVLAGVRVVSGQTPQEATGKNVAVLEKRVAVAAPVFERVQAVVAAHPGRNPYNALAGRLSPNDAGYKARGAQKYVQSLMTSGRVVNDRGEITDEGRRRIVEAAQWLDALTRRAAAAGQ